ncbi:MAG: DUF6776 family protein [Burkholderiaceae bacterium]
MRFRLLRRRLTISAPRMAVRSALPWPIRWALVATVLGFCAAIGVWAFELGKSIAGLAPNTQRELADLRQEVGSLRAQRDKAQSFVNTSGSLLTAEKAAQEMLGTQIRRLEAENRALRDDLGFFEKLIPANATEGLTIRALQAELLGGAQIKWQVLVMQPVKNAPEFNGSLELTFGGIQGGKPWSMTLPGGAMALKLRQYHRLEGVIDLPPQAVVKNVSARVLEGTTVRAVQTVKL